MTEPTEKTGEAPVVTPKRRAGLWKKGALALAVLGAAGGGAAWWMSRGEPVAAASAPSPSSRGLVTFEPFVVNLADGTGSHFLRVTVQLVIDGADEADRLQKTPVVIMQTRSAILELLTQQTSSALVTPPGKQALKQAITARVGAVLGDKKVVDVLFSEFVVQF